MSETAYRRSNESVRDEVDVTLRVAEGELPAALRGVLYRNGPGRQEVFGTPYDHPFDGDGLVTRFAFGDGAVRYRNRFVRTREFLEEERAGRMLHRSFGTNLPGGVRRNFLRLRFKNAANTSVMFHAGTLLALWEGGLPHRLDPETLETLGTWDFDGRLRNDSGILDRLMAPELPFSAHPKRDPITEEIVNFGTLMGRKNKLVTYRVDGRGRMRTPHMTPLDALAFVHDFVLTERHMVFYLSAVAFRVASALAGFSTPVGSLTGSDGAPARLLVVPRDGGPTTTLTTRPGFLFHFANGYDEGRNAIVLDGMRMNALPSAEATRSILRGARVPLPLTHPTRFVLDLETRSVSESKLSERTADLPTIDVRQTGRKHRIFYAVSGERGPREPFYHGILRHEVGVGDRVREFGDDLPGEAVFVPARADAPEPDGWLLTLVYRTAAHRTDLYVLRADDLETVCRLELPHHLPIGFHGTWVPAPRDA
jgi:all-trans-8'-apo-beta-carotenal 15,15'-oxygenase